MKEGGADRVNRVQRPPTFLCPRDFSSKLVCCLQVGDMYFFKSDSIHEVPGFVGSLARMNMGQPIRCQAAHISTRRRQYCTRPQVLFLYAPLGLLESSLSKEG